MQNNNSEFSQNNIAILQEKLQQPFTNKPNYRVRVEWLFTPGSPGPLRR